MVTEGELQQKMTFGKYKGQKLFEVLAEDPGYLLWADKNVDFFNLTEEIKDMAILACPPDRLEGINNPKPKRNSSPYRDYDDEEGIDEFYYGYGYDPEY